MELKDNFGLSYFFINNRLKKFYHKFVKKSLTIDQITYIIKSKGRINVNPAKVE